MKFKFLTTAASLMLSVGFFNASADEGMWLPSLISQRIGDMQQKGFRLDAEAIYSINSASLKDAVVLFGRGCTGEVISDEGLLLTNHHCGYSQIQKHSSVDHDYLRDGFWAMKRSEELPNEGLTVSFLDRMEDVTSAVLKGWSDAMSEGQRDSVVKVNSEAIVRKAEAEAEWIEAKVEALYYGNRYYLFVYRVFSDVRLVGAPPSSIGKFGGDTDNWMWPRHTGDFSIFRIYADKNNNPAPYSEDNVPYRPKKHFKISLNGVNEGDFTFVYGFPGRTQEYIMSEGVRYISEISDPHKIALRTARLAVQDKYMEQSQAVRIQYSSKNASVANSWKKWQGEMRGIRKMNTVAAKQDYEKRFAQWAEGTEYEGIIEKLDSLYSCLEPYAFAVDYYTETARTVELANFAMSWITALRGVLSAVLAGDEGEAVAGDGETVTEGDGMKAVMEAVQKAVRLADAFYKDWYLPIDKESFVAVMEMFDSNVPDSFKPDWFKEQTAAHRSISAWADVLFGESVFADRAALDAVSGCKDVCSDSGKTLSSGLKSALEMLSEDPAAEFGTRMREWYSTDILPTYRRLNSEITLLYRDYMRGQMEFEPQKAFYPDANLTLRVAYGAVSGYSPSDGTWYLPVSTIEGIMQKDNPLIFDYNIPQQLRDIYAGRDFGQWTIPLGNGQRSVPVCFIATNHTSGGNSGSPIINADGNLVGINFDRVWEGTMSDIVFDPDLCRNISLDIHYVLFIIDRLAGASHILDELDFAQ